MTYAFAQGKKIHGEITAEKNAKFVLPDSVALKSDVQYASGERNVLDVYRDVSHDGYLPIIIFVHGGDFFMGSKDSDVAFCFRLAQNGYLVFSVEYRLVPETRICGQLWDLCRAMDYVEEHAGIFDGDWNNVFMIGDNAGAQLIAYALAVQKSRRLARAIGVAPSGLKVNAVGLTRGMFQTAKFDLFGLLMRKYLWGENYKYSSVKRYVDPCVDEIAGSMAPCILITGSQDSHRRYTEDFYKAMLRNGIEGRKFIYTGDEDGYFTLFDPDTADGKATMNHLLGFFSNYIVNEVISDA